MKTQKEIEEMAEREYPIGSVKILELLKTGFIKGYQTAQEEIKWIDCKDALPENLVEVLVIRGIDNSYSVGRYEVAYKGWYTDYSSPHYDDVTHWMPLPQKP